MDTENRDNLVGRDAVSYWRNVDMYVGGSEHATGHLLYSRFWNKFLYDIGIAMDEEPFQVLRNQGMILASDGRKMSKRWGNTVTPDEMIARFGADSFRLYECFIGPFEASQPWIVDGLVGCARFCEKVWKLQSKVSVDAITDSNAVSALHKTIRKVTSDISDFKFNTAVASLMEMANTYTQCEHISRNDYIVFIRMLSVLAPHMTEEIYHSYYLERGSIHHSNWPDYDTELCIDTMMTIALQINAKLRATIDLPATSPEEEVILAVKASAEYQKWVGNTEPKKIIYVPGKIVSVIL